MLVSALSSLLLALSACTSDASDASPQDGTEASGAAIAARNDLETGIKQFEVVDGVLAIPAGGFDCTALAETFERPVTQLGDLLSTATSDQMFEALSNAQINLADGLQSCANGDHEDAAALFLAAVHSVEIADS